MKYALWNNKGGVGKTFLTFTIATGVAERLIKEGDTRKVVVIDLCPQANISEILLGGNGKGSTALQELINTEKTISGYFQSRMQNSVFEKTGSETNFVSEIESEKIPNNMLLVAGDPAVELQSGSITSYANQQIPADAWKNIHLWVDDLINAIVKKWGSDTIFFIDCNPSFSVYTELALVSADRLIIPCSPDGSSIRAVKNIARLVYGIGIEDNRYGDLHFPNRMKNAKMSPPKLHLFISNRATLYESANSKLAIAYDNLAKKLKTTVTQLCKENSDIFSERRPDDVFIDTFPDNHSIGIVMVSTGTPLGKIRIGKQQISEITINKAQKDKYKEFLNSLIDKLGLF